MDKNNYCCHGRSGSDGAAPSRIPLPIFFTMFACLSYGVTPAVGADDQNGAAKSTTTTSSSATSSSSLAETTIHLYYLVGGYTDNLVDGAKATLCSAPTAQLRVGADDGTKLTVAIDSEKPYGTPNTMFSAGSKESKEPPAGCSGYVKEHQQYTISKSTVLNASPTIQGPVSGILAVPFKYHISDHSTTAGSTIGGYFGYRTSVDNQISVTPVIAGGLALISTSPAQATTTTSSTNSAASTSTTTTTTGQTAGSKTSSGISVAMGLIGSVTSAASKGAQFGVLVGVDWLGKSAKYAYEGKPWIAFEIGYNFAL